MNFSIASNIKEYIYEDHLVLLNHTNNQLLVLNPSAQLVWQWLSKGYDNSKIIAQFSDFFKVSNFVAQQDVNKLCHNLHKHKLLLSSEEEKPTLIVNKHVISTHIDSQLFNTKNYYSLTNTPFSLSFNNNDILSSHIHSLFSNLEVPKQHVQKNFTLIKIAKKYVLFTEGQELFSDSIFETVKGYLIHEILKLSYPGSDWLTMLHAMAVAKKGRAIVMSAPSGFGKSTLTAALLKAGYNYLGDDLVPILRDTFCITPLLTSMSIKKGSWTILDSYYPELSQLPTHLSRKRNVRYLNPSSYIKTQKNLPVTALVFPQYKIEQDEAILQPISAIDALQRLLENEVWLGNPLKDEVVSEFLFWLKKVSLFSFSYGSLDQAVEKISEQFYE